MDNQSNPTDVFKRYSFEDMKNNLQTFLAPEDQAQEGDIIDEGKGDDLPFDKGGAQNNYALKSTPPKQSKVDQFDNLFS